MQMSLSEPLRMSHASKSIFSHRRTVRTYDYRYDSKQGRTIAFNIESRDGLSITVRATYTLGFYIPRTFNVPLAVAPRKKSNLSAGNQELLPFLVSPRFRI